MALLDDGKNKAMDGIILGTTYICLTLANDTELSGHGYARKAVSAGDWTVSSAGVATVSNVDVYTASDGSAQQAQKVGLASSTTGSINLLSAETLTTVPSAPGNGATFRLTSLTLNP